MNGDNANQPQSRAKALIWSAIGAIAGAFLLGSLSSGIFDAITGSGLPNPGGAIGAMVGAFAGGHFTFRYVTRRQQS